MPSSKVNRRYRYSKLLKIKPKVFLKLFKCFYIYKHSTEVFFQLVILDSWIHNKCVSRTVYVCTFFYITQVYTIDLRAQMLDLVQLGFRWKSCIWVQFYNLFLKIHLCCGRVWLSHRSIRRAMTQGSGTEHVFHQDRVGRLDKTSCFLLIARFCKSLGSEIIHSGEKCM